MIRAGTLCIVYRVDHKCADFMLNHFVVYDPPPPQDLNGLHCERCDERGITKVGEALTRYFNPVSERQCFLPARWLKPLPPLDEPVETERETVAVR